MPAVVLRACNAAIADGAEALFRPRVGADKQAAEYLGTALKTVRTCASERDTRVAGLRKFLAQQ